MNTDGAGNFDVFKDAVRASWSFFGRGQKEQTNEEKQKIIKPKEVNRKKGGKKRGKERKKDRKKERKKERMEERKKERRKEERQGKREKRVGEKNEMTGYFCRPDLLKKKKKKKKKSQVFCFLWQISIQE